MHAEHSNVKGYLVHVQHVMLSQQPNEPERQVQQALPRQRNLASALALCAQQHYAMQVSPHAMIYLQ